MKHKPWNKCDVCGRFIALQDFRKGGAVRKLVTPDSYLSREEYETFCRKHTNPFMNLDRVEGTIIGDYTRRVALVSPNGNVQRQSHIKCDECPKEWAKAKKAELLSQKCGDGKPLSFHAHLVESIYGAGEWDVRIWD